MIHKIYKSYKKGYECGWEVLRYQECVREISEDGLDLCIFFIFIFLDRILIIMIIYLFNLKLSLQMIFNWGHLESLM